MHPEHVKKLFFGREAELKRGLATLKAGWDVNGNRSRKFDKRPWVIHGESRSGKSHLARRIFAQLPETDQCLQCRISTGGRLDAIAVLRDLFEELRGRFFNRILDQRHADDPLRFVEVRLAKQLIEKIALFENTTQAATLTMEESRREAEEASLDLLGGTLLAKFLAKAQTERIHKNAIQLALRPPTALDLAEVCGIMIQTLLQRKLVRHVMILMDDVDLLETYLSPERNARVQRTLLADAIAVLHATPGCDVVVTARSWYAHSRKELQTLVDLSRSSPMTSQELLGIHDRRLAIYGRRAGSKEFLSRDALGKLASDVDGLPGVFLQHLNTAFYAYQQDLDFRVRDYEWLLDVFRQEIELVREKCRPGLDAIRNAVDQGRLTIDVTGGNPFSGTVLENEFVYQSYYSETTYFVSGFLRNVLLASKNENPLD